MFPATDGISETMSPHSIIAGLKLNYRKHCRLKFGTYVQVHEGYENSMATHTTGAIALRPTGNDQGRYYFFSLATATGRRLNCNQWTALPMPAEVIDRVHTLAHDGNALAGMAFTDHNGLIIKDDDDADDASYDPDNDSAHDDDDDDDHVIAGVHDKNANNETINNDGQPNEPNIEPDEPINETETITLNKEAITLNEEAIEIEDKQDEQTTFNVSKENDNQTRQEMDNKYGARNDTTCNLKDLETMVTSMPS
jgi:hypothetical protein